VCVMGLEMRSMGVFFQISNFGIWNRKNGRLRREIGSWYPCIRSANI
jgi:hypothetical protein